MVYNIPRQVTSLVEDVLFQGDSIVLKNSWELAQYDGPEPPEDETHYYKFEIFALDTKITLDESLINGSHGHPLRAHLKSAMQHHILGQAELNAPYTG